jgi:hypothetical protein
MESVRSLEETRSPPSTWSTDGIRDKAAVEAIHLGLYEALLFLVVTP